MTYISPINHTFPDPVATKLRRALYYSNVEIDPRKAISYYKQALELADELRMNPFSDEIIGIKITLAAMLEKVGQFKKSIEVLEIVRADCNKWIESVGATPEMAGDRGRILKKTTGIGVKLGELYSNEYVDDPEAAEKNLVEAVEVCLKEENRRRVEGVKEGEGEWLSSEEIGGSLEGMFRFLCLE